MKFLVIGLLTLGSFSSFAFECSQLKDLSSEQLKIVKEFAVVSGIRIVSGTVKDVADQIRAEKSVHSFVDVCVTEALQAKSTELLLQLGEN
jgi:hypothetical protein